MKIQSGIATNNRISDDSSTRIGTSQSRIFEPNDNPIADMKGSSVHCNHRNEIRSRIASSFFQTTRQVLLPVTVPITYTRLVSCHHSISLLPSA